MYRTIAWTKVASHGNCLKANQKLTEKHVSFFFIMHGLNSRPTHVDVITSGDFFRVESEEVQKEWLLAEEEDGIQQYIGQL